MFNLILKLLEVFVIILIHDVFGLIFYSWILAVRSHPTLSESNRKILHTIGVGGFILTSISLIISIIISIFKF